MEHRKICFVVAVNLALLFLLTSVSWAQIDVGNFTITGEGEVAGLPQKFSGKRSKFEEYRDIPETVIVPQLQLMIGGKRNDFYLEFDSTKPGLDDQNFRLRFGRYGLLDIEFEWDQIPHIFNVDTARTPFFHNGNGTYTLSSRPDPLGCPAGPAVPAPGTNCQNGRIDGVEVRDWLDENARRIDLKLFNGIGRFKLRYTPSPGWTFTGNYWSNNNSGRRAFGIINGGSPGGNISELPEPIDYQTHNIEVGGEYAGRGWSVALRYNGSVFHNNISTLVWDNPSHFTTGPAGTGNCVDSHNFNINGNTGPCRGRLDLYPSNQAHTITLTGVASLPLKSRFLGTVSYGWRLQDDSFLPFTINSAFAPLASGNTTTIPFNTTASLPRGSLDGDVRPLMVNATLVNNFIDRVDLKAFYRLYDLDNRSKSLFFGQGLIINDQNSNPIALAPTAECPTATNLPDTCVKTFPYAYSKQNMGFDAAYTPWRWLTAKMGYMFEIMHRERREVLDANEHSFGPTLDLKPTTWSLVRLSYKRMLRDAHDYDAGRQVVIRTTDDPEELREELLAELRKFDEAARQRDKFSFFTQVSPFQNLTLHGGFDFNKDLYPRTVIGVKDDIDYAPSIGFIYSPLDWMRVFADYNWERFDWKMEAIARNTGAGGCPDLAARTPENCPAATWRSRGRDQVNTISVGSDIQLIRDLLNFRIQYGFSDGRSAVRASGYDVVATGDALSNAPATDYQTITNRWHELLLRLQYMVHKNVSLKLGYYYNRYNEKDFGVDIMRPWMGEIESPLAGPAFSTGVGRSIFLGDRLKGAYTAHVGFLGLVLQF